MAKLGYLQQTDGGTSDLHMSDSADRPQVLAQLAKDISNLIRNSRTATSEAKPSGDTPGDARVSVFASSGLRDQARPLGRVLRDARAAAAPVSEDRVCGSGLQTASVSSTSRTVLAGEEESVVVADEPPSLLEAASVRAVDIQQDCLGSQPKATGFTSRAQGASARARSPQEVHALLANIESRETNLQRKVQQLTEEKCLREKRLEEEVQRLQRSNARLEDELRQTVQPAPEDPPDRASLTGRGDDEPFLTQELREDLQRQLQEIRDEVSRCARTLQAPEAMPYSEVLDIRQQLQALSAEVYQTSQALQGRVGAFCRTDERNACHNSELSDVSQQFEALQSHVSSALSAAMARPAEPLKACQEARPESSFRESPCQLSGREDELAKLRAEVNSLRAQLAQDRTQSAAPDLRGQDLRAGQQHDQMDHTQSAAPDLRGQDLRGQLQEQKDGELRPEANNLRAQTAQDRTQYAASEFRSQDLRGQLQEQMEALRSDLGQIAQAPLVDAAAPASFAPGVAALHGRLTAIRAEVAKVLQESHASEDTASPARQAHLSALLSELSDVRTNAALLARSAVAATPPPPTAENSSWQLHPQLLQQQYLQQFQQHQQQPAQLAAVNQQQPTQLAAPAAPYGAALHVTGFNDARYGDFQSPLFVEPFAACTPTVNELPRPGNNVEQRFVDMPIGSVDWSLRPSRDAFQGEFRSCHTASPPLFGQHPATDFGYGPNGFANVYSNNCGSGGYAWSSADATSQWSGNGCGGKVYTCSGPDATTQRLGGSCCCPPPPPSLQGLATGSRPSSARSGGGRSFESQQLHGSLSSSEPRNSGNWLPPEPHRRPSLAQYRPPEEPPDLAPQGLMRRPSRSQLLA